MSEKNNQDSGNITLMLRAIQNGEKEKISELIPTAVKEIRKIAKQQLYKRGMNNDMSVTTLIHELYIKFGSYVNKHDSFLEKSRYVKSDDFYRLCTTTIQRLIYDYCRRVKSKNQVTDSINDELNNFSWLSSKDRAVDIVLMVKEALAKLKRQGYERESEIIIYRYFGGFSDAEIGEILEISIPTVQRDLRRAESKLYFFLNPQIKEIYEDAREIQDKEKREKFIGEKCGDDERLKRAVLLLFN